METSVTRCTEELIEELKGVICEGVFNSRWELISTYHRVGQILTDNDLPIKQVAEELRQKERLLFQCKQFYKAYPNIDALPSGKNISWRKIANELLPEHKDRPDPEERLAQRIKAFFKDKNIGKDLHPVAEQIIREWEEYDG